MFLFSSAAGQQDPLADLLSRRGYDRDAILRQFPPDSENGENAAKFPYITPETDSDAKTDSNSDADSDSDSNSSSSSDFNSGLAGDSENGGAISTPIAPQFIPLRPRIADDAAGNIALVLPTMADGAAGQAARNFYEGCLHGAKFAGGKTEIRLYGFNGDTAEMARNYAAAVENGAAIVAGPMLKKNVRALLAAYPQAPSRTLLLQPGAGEGYFVMSLDAAREAADLARLLYEHFGGAAMIVEQPGPRGERMRKSFEQRWLSEGGALPARFVVRDSERDWQRLFDMLKEEEGEEIPVLFAAGDSDFAAKARGFAPQRYAVFAASTANAGARTNSALLLENLGFMEMPWLVGLDESLSDLDSPIARALPILRRRFFALGADACRAAKRTAGWNDGWAIRGLAGDWHLQNGVFVRIGQLAAYRSGRLQPL